MLAVWWVLAVKICREKIYESGFQDAMISGSLLYFGEICAFFIYFCGGVLRWLLSNTKLRENIIQFILGGDFTGDLAEARKARVYAFLIAGGHTAVIHKHSSCSR
jgi:hypothetical protein